MSWILVVMISIATTMVGQVGTTVQPTMFGIHQRDSVGCNSFQYPFFTIQAKAFRLWSSCNQTIQWNGIEPTKNVFTYANVDAVLAGLKTQGVQSVTMTLGSTPTWISANPTDNVCDGVNLGACDPPSDVNPDGTGTDQSWINFVVNLLTHITDTTYLQTHQKVNYYEIWNEFVRSDTLGTQICTTTTTCAYRGTYAQLLRMTQDLRCLVKGISSQPITATKKTCGTSGFTKIGYDPTASVAVGNTEMWLKYLDVLSNYLYCDQNPPTNTFCNYGTAGSDVTDMINIHAYFTGGRVPEFVIGHLLTARSILNVTDQQKPFLTNEGSWNLDSTNTITDPSIYPGLVIRWYLALLIGNSIQGDWFSWGGSTTTGYGTLWEPTQQTFPPQQCQITDSQGGFYCTGKTGYDQVVNWLVGKTVTGYTCPTLCTKSNPVGGVYTFSISGSGGYQAMIVWDSTVIQTCPNVQCGTTAYVSPTWVTDWIDSSGVKHLGRPTQVGANPIMMEATPAQIMPPTNLTVSIH